MDHLRATHASPGFIHAAQVDAEARAARRVADPDQGWRFTTAPPREDTRIRRMSRVETYWQAFAERDGKRESAKGVSEQNALDSLRRKLGLYAQPIDRA